NQAFSLVEVVGSPRRPDDCCLPEGRQREPPLQRLLEAEAQRPLRVRRIARDPLVAGRGVETERLRLPVACLEDDAAVAEPPRVRLELFEHLPAEAEAACLRRDVHALQLGTGLVEAADAAAADRSVVIVRPTGND